MSLALRANAIWKSYAAGVAGCSARVWVLRGASLVVERGECVAILGARGAGTTTLLHCLAGLRRTDAGRIECALPTLLVSSAANTVVRANRDDTDSVLLCEDDSPGPGGAVAQWHARARKRRGRTTIVATHDLSRVRHVIDRALILRDGKLMPLDRAAGVRRVAERIASRAPITPDDALVASARASDPPP
jgi:ABC-type multidrug transport system ATPase subunit